jgi:hypothetical protein
MEKQGYKEQLLSVGMEAIAIRSVRPITLEKLAKEMGVTMWYLGKAHNHALLALFQKKSVMYVDGDGKRSVKYEVMKHYIADVEPECMKNAQTELKEPEWFKECSRERLLGTFANN